MSIKDFKVIWQENWRYLKESFRRSAPEGRNIGRATPKEIRAVLNVQLRRHWRMSLAVFVCLLLAAVGELLTPMFMRYLIDNVLIARRIELLLPVLVGFAVIYGVLGMCQSSQSFISGRLQHRINLSLKEELTTHLLKLPGAFFDRVSSGYLAGRVMEDVRALSTFFGSPMQNFLMSLIKVVGALSMLFWFNVYLGLAIFVVLPLFFYAAKMFGKRHYTLSSNYSEGISNITGKLQETFSNIRLVKSSNAESGTMDSLNKHYEEIYHLNMEMTALTTLFQRIMRWLPDICRFGALAFASWCVIEGTWKVGDLVAVLGLVQMVMMPAKTLAFSMVQMASANASLGRLSSLLALVPEENLENGIVPELLKGNIEFRNVNFGYLPDKPVLEDFSLDIPFGKMSALIGPSGTGKSTVAALIMHFYTIPSGELKIDGVNINEYNLPALRHRVGYLGSDAKLFNSTLAENLRYGNQNATDDELFEVLERVGLSGILANGGLEQELEESAKNLSAGQQLRVALARELLRESDILILDEPTSALDHASELLIAKAVKHYAKNRTVLVITHREHLAEIADKCIYLKDKRVAGEGDYADIIEKFGKICSSGDQ